MNTLDYLKLANRQEGNNGRPFAINLVTNFTDGVLVRLLTGVLRSEGIEPDIFAVPYGQYHLHLKDRAGELFARQVDISFVFFDINNYRRSSFVVDPAHVHAVLDDLVEYIKETASPVIVANFLMPYRGAYGNLFTESPAYRLVMEANQRIQELAKEYPQLHVWDVNALAHRLGERNIRDLRGLYAFDAPFTNEFLLGVAKEWAAYIRAKEGRVKKCVVVDLDNTLWGGVVGETGALGVTLGPDYPGLAFVNFQHALLQMRDRGVILAIASRNNPEDALEVFAKNPHMVLREEHFAAMRINWEDKATHIAEIADELNIGVDSIVFLDDDAVNRDLVRSLLPTVAVPELPLAPEEYITTLFGLDHFNQFSLTDEDRVKGRMYAEERQRKVVERSAQSIDDYIKTLEIRIDVDLNRHASVQRIAQLTQKTNQFNLTTIRRTEGEITALIKNGALVFSGNVSDKFGEYGKTIVAIVQGEKGGDATLDTFLMSCRVMGRRVEYAFMSGLAEELVRRGTKRLSATFVSSQKNAPAAKFLPSLGFKKIKEDETGTTYSIDIALLCENAKRLGSLATVTKSS